jgi:hypothetical protein
MNEDMESIHNNNWELSTLLVGHCAIDLKWVYKLKCNEAGDVVRHKARLVAKGYGQGVRSTCRHGLR